MAAEHQYFYEDEVYRINKRGNVEFGMVLENSELVSSDDNSDIEDSVKMKKGHIRVAWHPTGAEEVVSEKKVGLADRSLMPGDVVRRMIKGKDTQRGYCRHMEVTACVQVIGTKHIINNIKSKDLVPLEELGADIAVCLDSWVGGIKVVHTRLHLRLQDNSKCIVLDPDSVGFDIFDEKKDPDSEFPHRGDYYPGQILWGPLGVLDEIGEWVTTSKERKTLSSKPNKIVKVMVEDVEIESVAVHWQCRAYSKDGAGTEKEQPKVVIQGKDLKRLKLLNVFEPCTLQVGDRNVYMLKGEDEVITKEQWRRQQRKLILNDSIQHPPIKRKRPNLSVFKKGDKKEELEENGNGEVKNEDTDSTNIKRLVQMRGFDISGKKKKKKKRVKKKYKCDEWNTETSESDTCSYASSSNASNNSLKHRKDGVSLPVRPWTKVLHKKKLRRAPPKKPPPITLQPNSKFIVETVSTMSSADVVWQDGSVEVGIPSTELYPIHHLDDQEFFPGDFVIENREEASMRVYGVVQSVDHAGRTATVNWFRTYTSTDNPQPSLLSTTEVSVYDLKDHPDFQYRPGTVVIRVANFQGEDEACTAGQVLDNYPEGRVLVWWVEGHVSMCWPQDLYKVGEYESEEGEPWEEVNSDDGSWQTESEEPLGGGGGGEGGEGLDVEVEPPEGRPPTPTRPPTPSTPPSPTAFPSQPATASTPLTNGLSYTNIMNVEPIADEQLKPKLASNIEKARIAMSRLEEIFTHNPSLQTTGVMRKLLEVYKDCRYLDKLMGTSFFHESHFQGLLERVRERGRATNSAQRVAEQVTRLFSPPTSASDQQSTYAQEGECLCGEVVVGGVDIVEVGGGGRLEEGSLASFEERVASLEERMASLEAAPPQPPPAPCICNAHVCAKLCSLILTQLVKAHSEVIKRFGSAGSSISLTEATTNSSPTSNSGGETQPLEEVTPTGISVTDTSIEVAEQNGSVSENDDLVAKPVDGGFTIMDTAPNSHKFKLTMFQPTEPKSFYRMVRNEIKLLRTSLPSGIWVKGFEDRMDLYSVMIVGPEKTPYEDGLFFFDFQLPPDYPKSPPNCHYVSYCCDRLNPNLYEDGKVCVSLLGTWNGKGTEVWTSTSNLLQVLVSIQGLILVSEPYFNEAGYEKQKGSQQGRENSRMYNEMVVLKLVQTVSKVLAHPQPVFKEEIQMHFDRAAPRLIERLESWLDLSESYNKTHPLSPTTPTSFKQLENDNQGEECSQPSCRSSSSCYCSGVPLPEFPLIPASRGFCLTLRKTLAQFRAALTQTSPHSAS